METETHRRMTAQSKVVHISSLDLGISFLLPQLSALRAGGFEVHAICPDGPLVSTFETSGIRVHRVEVTREITPLADLKLLSQLIKILRREQYTIVHTHTPKIEFVGQLAAWLAGAPVRLYTNHGLIFEGRAGLSKLMFKTVARAAGLFSDRIMSQSSEDISTVIQERIYPKQKLVYLGNGIDISEFRPGRFTPEQVAAKKRELGIPESHKVVGIVGRYVQEKGYREFFEAARTLSRLRDDVSFVTIGNQLESERDPVDFASLRELGIENHTVVLRARNDMPELYALMDVVALPSYREGFPRCLMEAAAMSLPVVASDVSGCRQAVIHGTNGFLVPVKNSDALAEKLRLLLDDGVLARAMGQAGRALAEERFDVGDVIERMQVCYHELLEQKLSPQKRSRFHQSQKVSRNSRFN
jgi:glycosyltransferase involved in cell wall biosynthesis